MTYASEPHWNVPPTRVVGGLALAQAQNAVAQVQAQGERTFSPRLKRPSPTWSKERRASPAWFSCSRTEKAAARRTRIGAWPSARGP